MSAQGPAVDGTRKLSRNANQLLVSQVRATSLRKVPSKSIVGARAARFREGESKDRSKERFAMTGQAGITNASKSIKDRSEERFVPFGGQHVRFISLAPIGCWVPPNVNNLRLRRGSIGNKRAIDDEQK